jgi:hypothetical protein
MWDFVMDKKWRWGRFSPRRTSVSPANLHSICFSKIIFTITRGWHNSPGVAAVPIASQNQNLKKKKLRVRKSTLFGGIRVEMRRTEATASVLMSCDIILLLK